MNDCSTELPRHMPIAMPNARLSKTIPNTTTKHSSTEIPFPK